MMQSAILLLRAGHHRPALTILGWERLNRVAPVHPDQLAAIGRLMPAVDEALDAASIAEATSQLTSGTLRDAVDFTRAALVEASRTATATPVAS
jgi:hypothetical protein